MTIPKAVVVAALAVVPVALMGQGKGLDPSAMLKPLTDSWPTYSGDYSGRRFSALAAVNRLTVTHLSLAWVAALRPGAGGGFGGPSTGSGQVARDLIVGGEGPGDPGGASGSGI